MALLDNLMLLNTGLGAVSGIGTAYAQSQAYRARADFESTMQAVNARFAALKAEDALRRGEKEAQRLQLKGRSLIARQRVAFAAGGLRLDVGTPLEAQEETAAAIATDALTIRNNAWREAWGYRVQSMGLLAQSEMTRQAGRFAEETTLLTGGLQAARDVARGVAVYRR